MQFTRKQENSLCAAVVWTWCPWDGVWRGKVHRLHDLVSIGVVHSLTHLLYSPPPSPLLTELLHFTLSQSGVQEEQDQLPCRIITHASSLPCIRSCIAGWLAAMAGRSPPFKLQFLNYPITTTIIKRRNLSNGICRNVSRGYHGEQLHIQELLQDTIYKRLRVWTESRRSMTSCKSSRNSVFPVAVPSLSLDGERTSVNQDMRGIMINCRRYYWSDDTSVLPHTLLLFVYPLSRWWCCWC